MDKGVLIIAAGSPFYGEMALNLCMSIKFNDKDAKVCLAHEGNALRHIAPYLINFDKLIQLPPESIRKNGIVDFLKAKTYLYDITPFDTTIFMDADTLWLQHKPVSKLFEELKDVDFTIACRGENVLKDANPDAFQWASVEELINIFNYEGVAYNLSSEFIYFKKTEEVKSFFDKVKSFYDEPIVKYTRFGGSVPDELAYQLAMIETGMKPHKVPYLPFYWEPFDRKMKQTWELTDKYAYSIGGNIIDPEVQNRYNNLNSFYSSHFGLKYSFAARNKRDWIPERHKV